MYIFTALTVLFTRIYTAYISENKSRWKDVTCYATFYYGIAYSEISVIFM
jgi:hypothetical protein